MIPRILCLILSFVLCASAQTTRHVSTTGSGTACTAVSPCTLATAVGGGSSPVAAGDVVELEQGIYSTSNSIIFSPSGSDKDHLTTFRAAAGARVIITSTTNTPPDIYFKNYVRVIGIWFGGTRESADGAGIYFGPQQDPGIQGFWKQMIGCTVFGYFSAVKGSSFEYGILQGNRFVRNGGEPFWHNVYISSNDPFPGPPGTVTNHVVADSNMCVGGEGYCIHFFHNLTGNIITRNRAFQTGEGIVHDFKDALVANNFVWKPAHESFYFPGLIHGLIINNILGQGAGWASTPEDAGNTIDTNAHLTGDGLPGTNKILLTSGSEATQLGASATTIDNAISALVSSFSASNSTILADSTIETNFAVLNNISVPSGSPIYQTGRKWFSTAVTNLGPDSGQIISNPPTVNEIGCLWQTYRSLGLLEYDSNGDVMSTGFLTCSPSGPINPRVAASGRTGVTSKGAASSRASATPRTAVQ